MSTSMRAWAWQSMVRALSMLCLVMRPRCVVAPRRRSAQRARPACRARPRVDVEVESLGVVESPRNRYAVRSFGHRLKAVNIARRCDDGVIALMQHPRLAFAQNRASVRATIVGAFVHRVLHGATI